MKVHVVYWSGTGNTQMMAEAVAEGAKGVGAGVSVIPVASAKIDVLDCDVLLLGCPAMGSENLEESEFEPFYQSIRDKLDGKRIALFGSYDWGDGEWIRSWQADAESMGALTVCGSVIVNNTPDEEGLRLCRDLGERAAKSVRNAYA